MSVRFVNNFSAALSAGISSDDTTLSFASGVGDAFRGKLGYALGSDHVYLTLYNAGGDIEYVKVTATSEDDFTVVRGQDNSTARAWLAGDMAACRPNAAALEAAVSLPDNLAHSGINLDITELRSLSTPLSVSQGGTGVTSLSALLTALGISFPLPVASGGTGVTSLSALKTAMSLTPGTDVMAYVAPGTSGNVLTSIGGSWVSSAPSTMTRGTAQATTSGSSKDFTGIPATANRITILLYGVLSSGINDDLLLQIGDSGGIETSGYVDGVLGSAFTLSTSAFAAATGTVILTRLSGNTWSTENNIGEPSTGYKALSATLDRVRLLSTGTFSAGEVNVMWE